MNHLRRELSPVTDAAWAQVDQEAIRSLKLYLAARRIVDVGEPVGWSVDAVPTGVVQQLPRDSEPGAHLGVRQAVPLIEVRTPFAMSLAELDSADRGNLAIDTNPVITAAQRAAASEDAIIFHGVGEVNQGILPMSTHESIPLGTNFAAYPAAVAAAVEVLRDAGIGGPYALVLGAAEFTGVSKTTEDGGYPVMEHLRAVLGGEVIWAPALTGGMVASTRGGDFHLTIGQDFSIGYAGVKGDEVLLYLEESIAFQVLTPEASVRLTA